MTLLVCLATLLLIVAASVHGFAPAAFQQQLFHHQWSALPVRRGQSVKQFLPQILSATPQDDNDEKENDNENSSSVQQQPKEVVVEMAGPRATARRSRRSGGAAAGRRPSPRPVRPRNNDNQPKYTVATKRAPHQYDHSQADARPFLKDARAQVQRQDANWGAPTFDAPDLETVPGQLLETDSSYVHIHTTSLDALFPHTRGFSRLFSANGAFRNALRDALRQDVYDSTPQYAGLPKKARRMLLLPDSSLQGSWRCATPVDNNNDKDENDDANDTSSPPPSLRMKRLTAVLQEYLTQHDDNTPETIPTGDEFMETIGALCGKPKDAPTHWMDIVGITDRQINHSWHQDTGTSGNNDSDKNTFTVLLGFPLPDDYTGAGVFSHVVQLTHEQWAPPGHAPNQPIVYHPEIADEYIVRPDFRAGQEIIYYRDVDVLHSAPDVAYRTSVMRFM